MPPRTRGQRGQRGTRGLRGRAADNTAIPLPPRDLSKSDDISTPEEYTKKADVTRVWKEYGVPRYTDREDSPPNYAGREWIWEHDDDDVNLGYWQLYLERREGRLENPVLVDLRFNAEDPDEIPPIGTWEKENCLYQFMCHDRHIREYEWAEACRQPGYSRHILKKFFDIFCHARRGNLSQNPEWEEYYAEDEEEYEVVDITGHFWRPGATPNSQELCYTVVWGDDDGNAAIPEDEDEYREDNERDVWIKAWEAGSPESASGLWRYWVQTHDSMEGSAPALIYKYWQRNKEVAPRDRPEQAKRVMQMDRDYLWADGKVGNGVSKGTTKAETACNLMAALGAPHARYRKLTHCSVCRGSFESSALADCNTCGRAFCITTAGGPGCADVTRATVDTPEGIKCVKCCKDDKMSKPPYNYLGNLTQWSQGSVHAEPIIVVMVHWQEKDMHSMSDLSSRIVKGYLGETYRSRKVAHRAHWVDVVLEDDCATWSSDQSNPVQAKGTRSIQVHIAELVRKMTYHYKKKFHFLMVVDVHSNDHDGKLLYNKGDTYHKFGTPLQVCTAIAGEVVPKNACEESTLILLTCSGMVLKALPSVMACTVGFNTVISFTAKVFNSQRVAEIWLAPFLRAFYRDHLPQEKAVLKGYTNEVSTPTFGLDIFVFGARGAGFRYTWGAPSKNLTGNENDLNCPKCGMLMQYKKKTLEGAWHFTCRHKCKGRAVFRFTDGENSVYELHPNPVDANYRILKIGLNIPSSGPYDIRPPLRPVDPKWLSVPGDV
ncbi:hypothetical protein CALCODRAFT_488309 [Calocera cornea HHB12733]|uniref:Uncharacterized protein n=3 Tax=Calocera cornea HHB12733 TaxID=1353952 RepID=A0A165CJS9_9BASI|nr:hypothetical protein CALCODRAFT_488309 [Calocera cornea HHB12733]